MGALVEDIALLDRTVTILMTVSQNQPCGIRRIANLTGLSDSAVRYVLHTLQCDGVIIPTRKGAVTTEKAPEYKASLNAMLRDSVSEIYVLMEKLMG